ncbi:periplasmic heavy metal sensor [Reyranella sp.]|uniref:periplasmic heavy metal sensor n=1 Tax=Reyranella sp. TaxID=1929291 RepID=UPI003BAC667D
MSWRWVSVLLALSVLLNAFFVAGFVFRGWIAPLPFEERRPPPPPGPRPSPLDMLAKEVDLDAGQRDALRAVFDHYTVSRRERLREIQKVREEIVAEHRKVPLDPVRIDPLIDRLSQLRADQQKDTLQALAQVEARLRPDQAARLHDVLADRLSGPPWRGPARPGRPPPRPPE